jgi:hypothetical protein
MSRAPKSKAAAFLAAMTPEGDVAPAAATISRGSGLSQHRTPSRTGLKHIGAYLDRATVEKVAILRARLDLDNSELIKLAIEELYAKQEAKRAFGDA